MRRRSSTSNPPATTVLPDTTDHPATPLWIGEAAVLIGWFQTSELLPKIEAALRLPRGRAGDYSGLDLFLVLLFYAVSGERTLQLFYQGIRGCQGALMGLVARVAFPSRSVLSIYLRDLTSLQVETFRSLFEGDALDVATRSAWSGGCVDRTGRRYVLSDADGTRGGGRQRAVVSGPDYPPVRRRLVACAPGYTGRNRWEVVRTRTALQQAHTREWLGTWGAPGNGTALDDLVAGCAMKKAYVTQLGLEPSRGILRLDGLYGYLPFIAPIVHAGLGYVGRCCHYTLLDHPTVKAAIAAGSVGILDQPDTGTRREVFDIPGLEWVSGTHTPIITRLIVTRRRLRPGQSRRVGKRKDGWIYELFVTSLPPEGFTACDVVDLYFARGGFEETLSDEDTEQATDRWCSTRANGQEVWQILEQWIWNLRIRLGRPKDVTVRETEWAAAIVPTRAVDPTLPTSEPPPPVAVEPVAHAEPPPLPADAPPVPEEPPPGRVAPASGRGYGRFGGADFIWSNGRLLCPAGATLHVVSRHAEPRGVRRVYRAPAASCATCRLRPKCQGRGAPSSSGRTVSVWENPIPSGEPSPTPVPEPTRPVAVAPPAPPTPLSVPALPPPTPLGPHPVIWQDIPAKAWRRTLHEDLHRQHVVIERVETPPPPPRLPTRATRAHRRLTWEERFQRNAHHGGETWRVHLHGVPAHLHVWLAQHAAPAP